MRKMTVAALFVCVTCALVLTACEKEATTPTAEPVPVTPAGTPTNPAAPTNPTAAAPTGAAPAAAGMQGKVLETMNSGGYTYVAFEQGGKKVWAAGPETQVKIGDDISMPDGAPMSNYTSKTLNRTFELVYFVPKINVGGAGAAEPAAAPTSAAAAAAGDPDDLGGGERTKAETAEITGITKAEGGQTIAEIYAGSKDLAGKDVIVRGKVVKYNGGIMGKNWMHIQDGTGTDGKNDLTITTQATAKVGDTVLVKSKLGTDKDFGGGYKYEVVLEDAQVTVE